MVCEVGGEEREKTKVGAFSLKYGCGGYRGFLNWRSYTLSPLAQGQTWKDEQKREKSMDNTEWERLLTVAETV